MQRNQRPGQMSNPLSDEKITQLAVQLMKSAKPETIEKVQAEVQRMPPEKRQELERRNINPMLFIFRQHAAMMGQDKRQQALINRQGGLGARPNGSKMSQMSQAPQMSAQQMGNTQSQMGVMDGNQDFDYCLNKLEQDVEPAAKALAVSEPMAIFHPGDGKSWLANSTIVAEFKYYNTN